MRIQILDNKGYEGTLEIGEVYETRVINGQLAISVDGKRINILKSGMGYKEVVLPTTHRKQY